MRHFFFVLTLCLVATVPAWAQSPLKGSVYSRFGLGELRTAPTSQSAALGGGGFALRSLFYANFANPATLGDQTLTRLSISGMLHRTDQRDEQDNTSRQADLSLGSVQLSLPLYDQKLGLGFQLAPYSRVAYTTGSEGVFISPLQDTTAFTAQFDGSGGLHRVDLSAGWQVSPTFAVGASINGLFGVISEARTTDFETTELLGSRFNTSTRVYGFGASVAAHANLGAFSAGGVVSIPIQLDAKRTRTLGASLDADTLGTELSGTLTLPMSFQGGMAYRLSSQVLAIADVVYEPWSSFESTLSWPGYGCPAGANCSNALNRFQDRLRVSGGVEFYPAGTRFFAPYRDRVSYRLGGYYDPSYVLPLDGRQLSTIGVTGGLSLPTLVPGTHVDVVLEAGFRGEAERNLIEDRFYKFSVTVNIGERWFERTRLR